MHDPRLKQLFVTYRQKGDIQALGELFDLLSPELLVVARHVSGDPAEAEDLVQAAFLTALEHPDRYDESRPLAAWFVGVLTKEAQSWRRQAARSPDGERALESLNLGEQRSRPDRKAVDGESAGLVRAALARLPERYRAVLEPHLQRGQSPSDIARDLGASPATVRVQLHRGFAQLRQWLPAGLAGGLALTLTERGLAQVRSELTTHAKLSAPSVAAQGGAALTALQLGSLLMTQRFVLGSLGIFVLLTAAYLGRDALWPGPGAPAPGLNSTALAEIPADMELVSLDAAVRGEVEAETPSVRTGGSPAQGALLVSTVWNDGSPAANIVFEYTLFGSKSQAGFAQTDASGVVLLEGLGFGRYGIYGDRGGNTTGWVKAPEAEGKLDTQRAILRLAKGHDVSGRVLDSMGRGVGDAEIWITNGLTRAAAMVVARSGPDGSYRVRQLTSQCFLGARTASHVGSRPVHVGTWLERNQAPVTLDLVLGDGGAELRGLVLDPAGRPIAGARVRVGKQGDFDTMGPDGPAGPPPPREVRTDENGLFACLGVAPGLVEFACKAPGFAVHSGRIQIAAGGSEDVKVQVRPGAWIRGVIRAPDGSPAEKVLIYASERALEYPQPRSSFASPRAETDAEGRFEVGPLAPGPVSVQASSYDGKQRANRNLEVVDGATYRWNLSLEGLPTIAGWAVDAGGAPLANWTVLAKSSGAFGPPACTTVCAADGSFELHLMGDQPRRLELYAPESRVRTDMGWTLRGAPRAWQDGVALGRSDVRLVLDPTQAPTGRITGGLESPMPLGHTKITVRHAVFGEIAELQMAPRSVAFEVPNLPAGTLQVQVESQGCADLWLRDLVLEQGQHLDLGTLAIQAGGDLRVRLQVEGQASVEHAQIELLDSEGNAWYAAWNGTAIEAAALPAGEYTLRVQAAGCGPALGNLSIVAGQRTELDWPLLPGGSIGLVFLDGEGHPLRSQVRLRVTTRAGAVVLEESMDSDQVSRWFFAPFGELLVVAEAADGRRCETALHFARTDGAEEARTLHLR